MTENKWEYRVQAGHLSPLTGKSSFQSRLGKSIDLVLTRQHLQTELWEMFVRQFAKATDTVDGGWKGEYWGKMMRGGVMLYQHTGNESVYRELENAVRLLLPTKRQDGVYSTYAMDNELFGWDVWGRKYVMLGLLYFLEICKEEALREEIISALKCEADGLLAKIGPGKIGICETSHIWGGINSCSVLEPIVLLYKLTGEKKYFDFATYIVENAGGVGDENIFLLALKDELYPHEYPVKKAYETMSCFEGLLEYYFVTGEEKWKTAVVNFVRRAREMEVSIIGCCGSEGEVFNGCTKKQHIRSYLMQETCVTVTWMKLCYRVAVLSGDAELAEEIERSLYNAMLGAVNFENTPENGGLPFDSYSALLYDTRGKGIGGMRVMEHGKFYGCCASIGSAGLGIGAMYTVMENEEGPVFQTYQQGEVHYRADGADAEIRIETKYPHDSMVKLHFVKAEGTFGVTLRIPAWCKQAVVTVCGEEKTAEGGGYVTLRRQWNSGDVVTLHFPMEVKAHTLGGYVAFSFGSVVLARDIRFDPNAGEVLSQTVDKTDMPTEAAIIAEAEILPASEKTQIKVRVKLDSGEELTLVDFASAGQTWNAQSAYEVWIKTA